MKNQTNNLVLDANGAQVSNVITWCVNNLNESEWDQEVLNFFPLRVKFKFNCPKQHVLAILSS